MVSAAAVDASGEAVVVGGGEAAPGVVEAAVLMGMDLRADCLGRLQKVVAVGRRREAKGGERRREARKEEAD